MLSLRAPTCLGISYIPVASGMFLAVKYLQQEGVKCWFPASRRKNCREKGGREYSSGCLLEGGTFLSASPVVSEMSCEWRKAVPCTSSGTAPSEARCVASWGGSHLAPWLPFCCAQLSSLAHGKHAKGSSRRCGKCLVLHWQHPLERHKGKLKITAIVAGLVRWTVKKVLSAAHYLLKLKETNVSLYSKLNSDQSMPGNRGRNVIYK